MSEQNIITRKELSTALASRLSLPEAQSRRMLDQVLLVLETHLRAGDCIDLRGFGRFAPSIAPARIARNPTTGQPVDVPARRRIKFAASPKILKAGVIAP